MHAGTRLLQYRVKSDDQVCMGRIAILDGKP